MQLTKKNLGQIASAGLPLPGPEIFDLPEKILQFGTGVLLRALPDYFVDKANRMEVFNGRILVVKSTTKGDIDFFEKQDGLYTLVIRGLENGIPVDQHIISSAISRVLSANDQWEDVLEAAANPELQIILSNTTEVGVQLVSESIFQLPPVSFPAKLLAFLYRRFEIFKGQPGSGMVIIPTELLSDNGKKLKSIVQELAKYNHLKENFSEWLNKENQFCNSLVDRIVPGKPGSETKEQLEQSWGYTDEIMTVCEPYRLWAIEGDEHLKKILSFHISDEGMVIVPDISKYKELKLRMLNATHSLSCGLAWLSGFQTVKAAMEDLFFESYIQNLMMDEIGPSIPIAIDEEEIRAFGFRVLDRFRNPFLQHAWLSIAMQYSSKLAMRVVPLLSAYYERNNRPPELMAMGFAAYILFMRPVKKDGLNFYGILNNQFYLINDDQASRFYGIWDEGTVDGIVKQILSDKSIWPEDLTKYEGFAPLVTKKLKGFIHHGTMHEISAYSNPVQ